MSDASKTLLEEIEEFTSNPIEWNVDDRFCDPVLFLDWLWIETYAEFQVDEEADLFDDPYSDALLPPPDQATALAVLVNFKERYPQAAARYVALTRPLWKLRAATPEEHPKHFPSGGMSTQEMREATRSGRSLLNPGLGPGQIVEMFWTLLVELCSRATLAFHPTFESLDEYRRRLRARICAVHTTRFVIHTCAPVGFAYGHPATALCFELDANTPLLHAYPVTNEEAAELQDGMPLICVSAFDGFLDFRQRVHEQVPFGKPRSSRTSSCS
jgi:hypothetical protein